MCIAVIVVVVISSSSSGPAWLGMQCVQGDGWNRPCMEFWGLEKSVGQEFFLFMIDYGSCDRVGI